MTVKYDCTAEDLVTKLESLASLGLVAVSRTDALTGYGYSWTVTFVDLPLPKAGFPLAGTDVALSVVEHVKGVDITLTVTPDGHRSHASRIAPYNYDRVAERGRAACCRSRPQSRPIRGRVGRRRRAGLLGVEPRARARRRRGAAGVPTTHYLLKWTTAADFGAAQTVELELTNDAGWAADV